MVILIVKRFSSRRLKMMMRTQIKTVVFAYRHDLSEDDFVEFSKNVQDRVIGTKDGVAHVCHRHYLLLFGLELMSVKIVHFCGKWYFDFWLIFFK